jgi:endonuclease G
MVFAGEEPATEPLQEVLDLPEATTTESEPFFQNSTPESEASHVFAGLPVVGDQVCEDYMVLENNSYKVGYCKSRMIALWSAYRFFQVDEIKSPEKRPSYKDDLRTGIKLGSKIYSKTGYDAGHLAPNAGIYNRYGKAGQVETFLLSNFGPQTPRLNRGPWRSLEFRLHRKYAQNLEEVWIVTGPVLKEGLPLIKGKVPIPNDYYKLVVDLKGSDPRVMAFLMPNTSKMGNLLDQAFILKAEDDGKIAYEGLERTFVETLTIYELKSFLVAVDEVEERTGIDFYSELSDTVEDELEAAQPTEIWPEFK